ncbi:RHS repeat-associated core domain-containing protein [Pseudomonas sp. MLB6B]
MKSAYFYGNDTLVLATVGLSSTRLFRTGMPLAELPSDQGVRTLLIDRAQTVLGVSDGEHRCSFSPYCWMGTRTKALLAFNGHWLDRTTHSYPLGAGQRSYSPALMRFCSSDSLSPFGVGGLNAYVYCQNDPINKRDDSGHSPGLHNNLKRLHELGPALLASHKNQRLAGYQYDAGKNTFTEFRARSHTGGFAGTLVSKASKPDGLNPGDIQGDFFVSTDMSLFIKTKTVQSQTAAQSSTFASVSLEGYSDVFQRAGYKRWSVNPMFARVSDLASGNFGPEMLIDRDGMRVFNPNASGNTHAGAIDQCGTSVAEMSRIRGKT